PPPPRLVLRRRQRARPRALLLPGVADPATLAPARARAGRRRHEGSDLLDADRARVPPRGLPDPAGGDPGARRAPAPALACLVATGALPTRLPSRALRAHHAARLRSLALLRRRQAHRRRARLRLSPHSLGVGEPARDGVSGRGRTAGLPSSENANAVPRPAKPARQ